MKVEIEYEEVEKLKKTIEKQADEIRELNTELQSLDKVKLESDAVDLAHNMFDAYATGIFSKLGFTHTRVDFGDNLSHWLGKGWYISDKLKVDFGAQITNEFKQAFIRLGIAVEEKPNDK